MQSLGAEVGGIPPRAGPHSSSATAVLGHGRGAAWVEGGLGKNASVVLRMQRHHYPYMRQVSFNGDPLMHLRAPHLVIIPPVPVSWSPAA